MNALLRRIDDGQTHLIVDYLAQVEAPDLETLMRAAAQYGDLSAMKLLLARGATLSQLHPHALSTAAFHGHLHLCQFLIVNGMPVDDRIIETGETSLHSVFGLPYGPAHDDVLRVLLDAGADVTARTIPGVRTETFTHSTTRGETALHRAAAFGSLASVEMLLGCGADPAAPDANGETPLNWASWHRRAGDILGPLRRSRS
jgi:uncharacterized protein